MGWFDGTSDLGGGHHHSSSSHHHSSSKHQHSSGSIFGLGESKHNRSSSSIFGSGDHKHNRSSSSFFGFGRSSSYYKRSPRGGYLKRIYSQLRRLFRDLIYYMKRHPMKVFVLVIMPLITGGALTGLLAKFGIRLPGGLDRMFGGGGMGGSSFGGTTIGRGHGGGLQFERSKVEGPLGALGGLGGLGGGMGAVGGAMNLAKMFM